MKIIFIYNCFFFDILYYKKICFYEYYSFYNFLNNMNIMVKIKKNKIIRV